jgi:hypothetical protein
MVEKMKVRFNKLIFFLFAILPVVLQISSCNDPIFYKIHEETEVLEPKINGSPVNYVIYDKKMYTASGRRIFSYSGGNWSEWKKMDGNVMMLAAAGNSLYTLSFEDGKGRLRRYNNTGSSGEDIGISYNIQSIHASDNVLFASVKDNNNYKIYYLDEKLSPASAALTEIANTESGSILKGAAFDQKYYYLCTNSGIFCVDPASPASALPDPFVPDANFTGIINLNDEYVAAISANGRIFEINDNTCTEVVKTSFPDNQNSTGALALWFKDNDDSAPPSLLLAGRKEIYYSTTTGYSNGYVEFELDEFGRIKQNASNEPGKNALSSVDNYDRYTSSIGKKPLNHIIQTPSIVDKEMTLFASTQQNGVWSYRNREEGWQWNAEE